MSTAGSALKGSRPCRASLGASLGFLGLGQMVSGLESADLEALDQMGQMAKAGSRGFLGWALEVRALVN